MSNDPADTPKKDELSDNPEEFSIEPSEEEGDFMSFEEFSQLDNNSAAESPAPADPGLSEDSFSDLPIEIEDSLSDLDTSFDESELEEFASFDEPGSFDIGEDLGEDIGIDEEVLDTPIPDNPEMPEVSEVQEAAPEMQDPFASDGQESNDLALGLDAGLEDNEPGDIAGDDLDLGSDMESEDSMDDDWDNDFDDDWDGDGDGEESGDSKPKKETKAKKPMELSFNTIVIGGGVVLGIGVLVFQVMTTKPAVQKEETIQTALTMTGAIGNPVLGDRAAGGATANNVDNESSGESSKQGFLNNPNALKQAQENAKNSQNQEQEAASSNQSAARPTTPPQPTPMSRDSGDSQRSIVSESNDGLSSATRNAGTQARLGIPSNQTAEQNVGRSASAIDSDAVKKISSQLDTLSGEMNKVSKRIGDLENKVSTMDRSVTNSTQAGNASNESMEQMRRTIDSLKGQVGFLQTEVKEMSVNQKAVSASASVSAGQDVSNLFPSNNDSVRSEPQNQTQRNQSVQKATSTPRAPGSKPKTWQTSMSSANERGQTAVSAGGTAGSFMQWRLRSAQPGRAWVSRLGDNAITMVRVGNTLPGVGRILAINSVNGRWEVRGEQAVITQ